MDCLKVRELCEALEHEAVLIADRNDDLDMSGALLKVRTCEDLLANIKAEVSDRKLDPFNCSHSLGYRYLGAIPCTGIRVCRLCGAPAPKEETSNYSPSDDFGRWRI